MTRGRLHAPELTALLAPPDAARATVLLRAPAPGLFAPSIARGDLVAPGSSIGELVVLGRASALIVPAAAPAGIALALLLRTAVHPVGYGDVLVELDPSLSLAARATGAAGTAAVAASVDGLVFPAPTSGRFYVRPGPDKPPFVAEGTELAAGTTICLLEVMKTFHRVTYGGPGLPTTARVRRVLVADGADVNAGDPLLALE